MMEKLHPAFVAEPPLANEARVDRTAPLRVESGPVGAAEGQGETVVSKFLSSFAGSAQKPAEELSNNGPAEPQPTLSQDGADTESQVDAKGRVDPETSPTPGVLDQRQSSAESGSERGSQADLPNVGHQGLALTRVPTSSPLSIDERSDVSSKTGLTRTDTPGVYVESAGDVSVAVEGPAFHQTGASANELRGDSLAARPEQQGKFTDQIALGAPGETQKTQTQSAPENAPAPRNDGVEVKASTRLEHAPHDGLLKAEPKLSAPSVSASPDSPASGRTVDQRVERATPSAVQSSTFATSEAEKALPNAATSKPQESAFGLSASRSEGLPDATGTGALAKDAGRHPKESQQVATAPANSRSDAGEISFKTPVRLETPAPIKTQSELASPKLNDLASDDGARDLSEGRLASRALESTAADAGKGRTPDANVNKPAQTTVVSVGHIAEAPGVSTAPIEAEFAPQIAVSGREEGLSSPKLDAVVTSKSEMQTAKTVLLQIREVAVTAQERLTEIQLSPEELGRLKLTFSSGESAQLLSIQAERPETLDLIRKNLDLLRAEMGEVGYNMEDVDLSSGFDRGQTNEGLMLEVSEEQFLQSAPEDELHPPPSKPLSHFRADGRLDIRL